MKKTIIETKDLCKSFITGKNANNVLKNINISIYEGDFTVIMGECVNIGLNQEKPYK